MRVRLAIVLAGLVVVVVATPAQGAVTIDHHEGQITVNASTRLPGQAFTGNTVREDLAPGSGGFTFSHNLGPQSKVETLDCPGAPDDVRLEGNGNSSGVDASASDGDGLSLSYSGTGGGDASISVPDQCAGDGYRASGGTGNFVRVDFTLTEPQEFSWSASVSGSLPFDPRVRLSGPGTNFKDTGTAEGVMQPGSYTFQANAGATAILVAPGSDIESASVSASLQIGGDPPPPAPPVAIGSGPSGFTNQRSAAFDFTAVADPVPAGRFECRLDGSGDTGFSSCSSPTVVNGLSDGEHVFAVRYHPDGEDPGPATERRWTVDTAPPEVVFDHAPSGEDNPPEAELVFHSTEPEGATFRCVVDSGPLFECASPHVMFDLAPGPHVFEVQASDRAGNDSAPETAQWVVGVGAGPQTAACPGGALSEAGFGVIRLVAREVDGCFVDELVNGVAAKVARGKVALNGVELTPEPGTRIIVTQGLGDGSVRADGPLRVAFGGVFENLPRLDLLGLSTSANRINKELQFAEGLLKAAGMESFPGVQLEFSAANGGQTKVTMRLTLPRAFSNLPGSGNSLTGVTVTFAPIVSNDRGVDFAGRIKLSRVNLFKVQIKDLDLAYDHSTGVFDGSFSVALGDRVVGRPEPTLTGSIGIAPTSSPCFLSKLGLVGSDIGKHLGDGLFFQRLGGTFTCTSEGGRVVSKLSGNVGLSLGGRVEVGSFRAEAVSLDGVGTLTLPVEDTPLPDFGFEIVGSGKLVEIPVTSQTIKFTPPAQTEWNGQLDATIGGHGVLLAQRNTWVAPEGFNFEGVGTVNFFGVGASAEGVVSTTGFAFCMGPPDHHVGFGKRWGEELTTFTVCDVGPFRTAAPARAAQAGPRTFAVKRAGRVHVVALAGSGDPPKVLLSGPRGERIGPDPVSTRGHMLVRDDDSDTTFVTLFSPAAGRWTVTPADGSAPISRLRLAEGLPPVKLSAKVSGKGSRRTLRWKGGGLGGQRIQFIERGRGDHANVLRTVARRRGSLRFTPDPALGTSRRIEAIVLNRGIPRYTSTVARYRVAPPPRARRVKGLRLRGKTLSWRGQPGLKSYELAITRPDGSQTTHSTRRARIALRRLPRRGRIVVEIVALDRLDRPGPVTRATLTAR